MVGKVARRISMIAHRYRFNGPQVGAFIFARTTVCSVSMQLITHEKDKIISEWIRTGRNWSKLGLAEYQQVAEYARTANTIVDVGSNIGIVSILISRSAPDAQIFAFEPDPLNFALSQINFELNGCHNIAAINAAVADFTGPILLHKASQNWGDHRTYTPNERGAKVGSQTTRIFAISPTAFFSAVDGQPGPHDVDLVKISTQGSDIKILRAFHPLLKPGSKVVLQFSPSHLRASGTSEQDIRAALSPAGRVQAIGPHADGQCDLYPRDVTIEELIAFFRTGAQGFETVGYCHVLAEWR
jgi:FkbM family methyltransferase